MYLSAFSDPEVAAAFKDISSNPANIMKYQNNPKVMSLVTKMAGKMGAGGPGGGAGGGMPGMGGMGGLGGDREYLFRLAVHMCCLRARWHDGWTRRSLWRHGRRRGRGPGRGGKVGRGAGQRISRGIVCPSVCCLSVTR